ncbi:MAG: alpha-2-macroglobulin [Prevotella sp.]|nr:alpha-2-macroglobulin [Prevotella sp.]
MKRFLTVLLTTIIISVTMNGQTYSSLWRQVSEAERQDLPQTEQQALNQIVAKAERENNYGQLLKAELQYWRSQCNVSPDSLRPAVDALKGRLELAQDNKVLQSVISTVLGYIYQNNAWLDERGHQEVARQYYDQALANSQALAAVHAQDYEPLVDRGSDSRIFGDDLLAIVCREAGRYDILAAHYKASGNRQGAMLASLEMLRQHRPQEQQQLNKSAYLQSVDSLIAEYSDLPECGEAVLERYSFMDQNTNATAEQKWQYIAQALEQWNSWPRMNQLRNQQRMLQAVNFTIEMEQRVLTPGKGQTLKLHDLRGITELTLRLYRVRASGNIEADPETTDGYRILRPLLTAMPEQAQTRRYVGKRPYELYDDSIALPPLPAGIYMVEAESQPTTATARKLLFVSDVRILTQSQPDPQHSGERQLRMVVVNATTGLPLPGARIKVQSGYGQDRQETTLTANENGECFCQQDSRTYINMFRPYTDADTYCPPMNFYGHFAFYDVAHQSHNTVIYTDRSIYRPGQTVMAAAIVYDTDGIETRATKGRLVAFTLTDANGNDIDEKEATTDDYGTCSVVFTLPRQGLNGTFTIIADGETHTFRVEEYKRPTFEVDIPAVARSYEDGDTVVVRGTARTYSGAPVQQARVKYRVVRNRAFWWMGYARHWLTNPALLGTDNEEVAQGETMTQADGSFSVDVPMTIPQTRHTMFYNFVLTAEVTDQGGETREGQLTLPLGNRTTAFTATLSDKVLSEGEEQMAFHLQNAAGVDMDATVRYRFDNGRWQEVQTNSLIPIPQMRSGSHTLHAVCQNDTLDKTFTVFSLNDTRPATGTDFWAYTSNDRFTWGDDGSQPVTVQVGSSASNVHIVYSMMAGDSLLESGSVRRSNELLNRKLSYRPEYGDGVLLTFAWMKDGKAYHYETTIQRPMPEKHLDMRWSTFRNRLEPGQQEEWTLTVKNPDGTPADAQVMATLYDKSLDQIESHEWHLVPHISINMPHTMWSYAEWGPQMLHADRRMSWLTVPELQLNHIDHTVFPQYNLYMLYTRGPRYRKAVGMMDVEESAAITADNTAGEADSEEQQQAAPVQLRQNLQETAFFMPTLQTDTATGSVALRFTLPESLTTWRFMAVAHTKDMMYATMRDEAIARKDVMVQPNMPRFIRQGDNAAITARIINTTDRTITGTARLQLLDPETEQLLANQQQQVTVADSSTVSTTFTIDTNTPQLSGRTILIARISVSTATHSDGEQHYIALLPNQERVTVTMPFTQQGSETKVIDLQSLINPQTSNLNSQITIEYTNTPAWFMVQALPTVGHPNDDCALCQAASLYANTIGQHILSQNPQARTVFTLWQQEQDSDSPTLLSELEKNQELRDLVLNETPWVADANSETEQRQRLADFFNENMIAQRLTQATDKLRSLQNSDGSWSWWPGMNSSQWMTMAVTKMLVRLNMMTGAQDATSEMTDAAFNFLGHEMVETVRRMKEAERNGQRQAFPGGIALEWLYTCAIDGRQLPANVADANQYLTSLLRRETRNQSIYDKALSAIILNNRTYVRSLKEYTVFRDGMGRYYDTPRASYSWRDYRLPTQVAAIEALQRLTPQDTLTISQMQQWLLQQKRTQAWDTPLNSTDAIYAFLNNRQQVLAPQPQSTLSIDGQPLNTATSPTAGLGYIKTALPYSGQHTLTVQKESTGTSWGAVYAQFMQPIQDITSQASGISVTREILSAEAHSQSTILNVGTRVKVRITIEAEQDMDFVEVIDKRAACMEPVRQLSGYDYLSQCYRTTRDNATCYYFDQLGKGRHIIETEYYIDRTGTYQTGTCTVQCAYAPEFRATAPALTIQVTQ